MNNMRSEFKRILFKVEHLEIMDMRSIEQETILGNEKIMQLLKTQNNCLDAITLVYDGRIIACMGFVETFPGIADVWLIPSIHIRKIPKMFLIEIKQYLNAIMQALNFHRLQTVGRTDVFHVKWMEYIGFKCEGTLKNFYKNQDYLLWART